jgi:hypothetical protein
MREIQRLIMDRRFSVSEIAEIAGSSLEETDHFIWAKESFHLGEIAIIERKFANMYGALWWQLGAVQTDGDRFFFDVIASVSAVGVGFTAEFDNKTLGKLGYTIKRTSTKQGEASKCLRREMGILVLETDFD